MSGEWKSWRLHIIYAAKINTQNCAPASRFINRCWNSGPRYLQVRAAPNQCSDGPAATLFAHGAKSWTPEFREWCLRNFAWQRLSLSSAASAAEHCCVRSRDASERRALVASGVSLRATEQKGFSLFKTRSSAHEENISVMSKDPFSFLVVLRDAYCARSVCYCQLIWHFFVIKKGTKYLMMGAPYMVSIAAKF